MPTADSILAVLKAKGSEKARAIYARHGMDPDRVYGVSIADLKVVAKTMKGQHSVACDLLATGNLDAMYLAGMVGDGAKMTPGQLNQWLDSAAGLQMVTEYTIPWLAVENPEGRRLALAWIKSKKEHVAAAGWCTWSGLVATQPDSSLDLAEVEDLLSRVVRELSSAPNRVRQCMNNFVIAVGSYVAPLLEAAKAASRQLGVVRVDMGDTACKTPDALASIEKVEARGSVGKKRKTMRC
jgi:3-methyladenine DNA glycosylase AlkD